MVLVWLFHYLTGDTIGYLFGVNQSTLSRNLAHVAGLTKPGASSDALVAPKGRRYSFIDSSMPSLTCLRASM
jgi:hypothetical protein